MLNQCLISYVVIRKIAGGSPNHRAGSQAQRAGLPGTWPARRVVTVSSILSKGISTIIHEEATVAFNLNDTGLGLPAPKPTDA
jgi:hypothetical protein